MLDIILAVLITLGTTIAAPNASAVKGPATWYGTGPGAGHAAAGPSLRSALGSHWRGSRVSVCHAGKCVRVVLDDWCACGHGRVIDLSDEDFKRLAPLSEGVITVSIATGKVATPRAKAPSSQPRPTAPPTDIG